MHIILVKFTLYVTEQDKKTRTSSFHFPTKLCLSSKILKNPTRFSNFGVNIPECLEGVVVLDLMALWECSSNIKPSCRTRTKENEK